MEEKPKKLDRIEILMALAQYNEEGDFGFIETVNNITWRYKVAVQSKNKNNENK